MLMFLKYFLFEFGRSLTIFSTIILLFSLFLPASSSARSSAKSKCGSPPSISNAQYDAPAHKTEFNLGAVILYSCVNGFYRADGGMPRAKCLVVNGTTRWLGPNIHCIPRSCGNPGTLLNGRQDGLVFEYTFSVKYHCLEGYELVGSPVRRCQADGTWSGIEPQCKPIQCPEPSDPLHGKVLGQTLDYLSKITYSCDKGYRLVGQIPRTCQADSTWSGQNPVCEEIRCQTISQLENGYVRGSDTKYNAVIMFNCNADAYHFGAHFARCEKDGSWSKPPPKCLAACPLPKINFGQVRKIHGSDKVTHDQQVEIKCDEKYELEAGEFPRCANGQWSNVPNCIPLRCKKWPPNIKNGYVMFVSTNHGSAAKYQCKSGFALKKGNEIITCRFGVWDGEVPECEEIFCEHPNDAGIFLNNGKIKLEGSMGTYEYRKYIRGIGEYRNIIFECQKGFVLIGPKKATCVNGTWEPRNIKRDCVEQTHAPTDEILWYRADLSVPQLIPSADSPNFDKNERYKRYSELESGTRDSHCPPLETVPGRLIVNERFNADHKGWYPEGSVVKVQCLSGYQMESSTAPKYTLHCSSGAWSQRLDNCLQRICALPNIPNGFFTINGDIQAFGVNVGHGIKAKLYCVNGYDIRGTDIFECRFGQPLNSLGACVPKFCQIFSITHGHYLPVDMPLRNGTPHASALRFQCTDSRFPNPALLNDRTTGEVYCSFGEILPHRPECDEEESSELVIASSVAGCRRPYNVANAWVYVYESGSSDKSTDGYFISPFLAVYPNKTIVHYKCSRFDSNSVLDRSNHAEQANAIQCTNGRWVALLEPCRDDVPSGISSSDTSLFALQNNDEKSICLKLNLSNAEVLVGNTTYRSNYRFGDKIIVQCKYDAAKRWTLECKRGTWKNADRVECTNNSMVLSEPTKHCIFDPAKFKSAFIFNLNRGEIMKFKEEQPENTTLSIRCHHVGIMKFSGSHMLRCEHGEWHGIWPNCQSLIFPFPTKADNPPAILYRTREGNLTISMSGEIYVTKSSLLELDCWDPSSKTINRQLRWDFSNTYRQYPQKWVNGTLLDSTEVGDLDFVIGPSEIKVFRLTIFIAQPEDSGSFSCTSTSGQRHSVNVIVADIQCPPLRISNDESRLRVETSRNNFLGSVAHFFCTPGFTLRGPVRLYCLNNMKWSNEIPHCQLSSCPRLHLANGFIINVTLENSIQYARFKCFPGYKLEGPSTIRCQEDRVWHEDPPMCLSEKHT